MKNIFLLPTEESSRIGIFVDTQKLILRSEKDIPRGENVNIYITSEEEVNVNDHVIVSCSEAEIEEVRIVTGYYNEQFLFDDKSQIHMDYCKKIILTTDFRLAPDVQKIDDEFLEWFVKNPGCEFVHAYNDRVVGYEYDNYTIIIPTEETKPHYFCETPEEKCTMNYCDENGCQNRKRNLAETENYPIGGYAPGSYMCNCSTCKKQFMGDKRAVQCEPCAVEMVKKSRLETLEEAAANLADPNICKTDNWIAGANWQAERMYTEEDMIEFSEWVNINSPNQHNYVRAIQKRYHGIYVPEEKLKGYYSTKELFEKFKNEKDGKDINS